MEDAKQIARKPIMLHHEGFDDEYLSCPNCKTMLTDYIPGNPKDFYFYCINCGQKFDWND